jgi:alpha/beta superfamily hydrolase
VTSERLREREIQFPGPVGRLEGRLAEGASHGAATLLALHPHPLYGGTMDNNVVEAAVRAGQAGGLATLRFNFRGAGLSQGSYDNGVGEQDDVDAALDLLEQRLYPQAKVLVGYSFGASIALAYCHRPDHGVGSLVLIAPPPFLLDETLSLGLPVVKKILLAEHDEIAPPEEVTSRAFACGVGDRIDVIADTDHFFSGREADIEHRLSGLLAALKQKSGPFP